MTSLETRKHFNVNNRLPQEQIQKMTWILIRDLYVNTLFIVVDIINSRCKKYLLLGDLFELKQPLDVNIH